MLMDAIVLTIFTYGPVDRVGIIRKLRLNETLMRGDDGSYSVDLTKAMRSHKSAKYHGGTKHTLPPPTWPLLDKLCQLTQFDLQVGVKTYYVLHNTRTRDASRPLTEGPFGQWVAGLFLKYSGTRVVPKNLRSIFIVWLRDQEGATDKILAASATAMRHHLNTQQSLSYDVETNNRQIALANTFAAKFAEQFKPTSGVVAGGSGGGSGVSGGGGTVDNDNEDGEWATTVGIWYGKRTDGQPADAAMLQYSILLPVSTFAGYRKGDLVHFNVPGADDMACHSLPTLPTSGALRFKYMLDAGLATDDTISITQIKMKRVTAAAAPAPVPAAEDDEAADAMQAVIRSNHLETNLLGDMPTDPSPLAGQAREVLCRSREPLEGEQGEVANELAAPPAAAPSPAAAAPTAATGRAGKRVTVAPKRLDNLWKTPRATASATAPTPMTDEWSDGGFAAHDVVEAMGRAPSGDRDWFKAIVTKIRTKPSWPPIVVKYTATLTGVM